MADREPVDRDKRTTIRRFAALGAVSPLGVLDGNSTDRDAADTRRAIAGYLATTPGAHFSKVRDDLSLGTGETQYHLRKLVDAGAIESQTDGEYRRYFPAGRFGAFERTALGYLRRETSRRVILALLVDPELSGRDLADRLDVSTATVSRTAAELADVGLLSREDRTIERPETLIALLVRYAESFDEETRAFADRIDDLIAYDPA